MSKTIVLLLEPDKNLAKEYLERLSKLKSKCEVNHFTDANSLVEFIDTNSLKPEKQIVIISEIQSGKINSLELLNELAGHNDSHDIPVLLTGFQQPKDVLHLQKNFPNIVDYYLKTGVSPVLRFDKAVEKLLAVTGVSLRAATRNLGAHRSETEQDLDVNSPGLRLGGRNDNTLLGDNS